MRAQRTSKTLYQLIACIVLLSRFGSAALALPYGAVVTARQISPTVWSYTLYNTSTSQDYWLCEVALEASPINVITPNGWEANWNGKDGCDWIGGGGPFGAPCPNMIVTGWNAPLGVGQFLGGFEVDFGSREPDSNETAGLWWASFSGPSGTAESTGYVIPVPEPSSALCLGTAISFLGGLFARKRRKSFPTFLVSVSLLVALAGVALAEGEVQIMDAEPGSPACRPAEMMPSFPATFEQPEGYTHLWAFPRFFWSYGCVPTCGAMIVGYYDNAGFPNMVRHPDSSDYLCPTGNYPNDNGDFLKQGDVRDKYPSRCAISATEAGVFGRASNNKGHVDDYVATTDWTNPANSDPYLTSTSWTQNWAMHTDDCVADFMGASIRYWRNNTYDGDSQINYTALNQTEGPRVWVPPFYPYSNPPLSQNPSHTLYSVDAIYGLGRYIADYAGYYCKTSTAGNQTDTYNDVSSYYSRYVKGCKLAGWVYGPLATGVVEQDIVDEIDAGRPVIISVIGVTSGNNLNKRHAIVAWGYKWCLSRRQWIVEKAGGSTPTGSVRIGWQTHQEEERTTNAKRVSDYGQEW